MQDMREQVLSIHWGHSHKQAVPVCGPFLQAGGSCMHAMRIQGPFSYAAVVLQNLRFGYGFGPISYTELRFQLRTLNTMEFFRNSHVSKGIQFFR
jgi:hypothetical protein